MNNEKQKIMKRTKKEQKARGKKYGEKVKNRGVLTRAGLGAMAANLLSSYNDKF